MERRELMAVAGVVGAVAATSRAFAQGTALSMHPPKYKMLEETSGHCVASGNDCLRHCLGMMSMNDVSMSGCTSSVYELITACSALQTLAAVNSTHIVSFARAVGEICARCQGECEKYPDIAECKACATSCKMCSEECRKVTA